MVETLLYLSASVLSAPARVIALVRTAERAYDRFAAYLGRSDFQIVVQDVCQPISFPDRLDFIIHAASHASPRFYRVDPVGTLSPNVIGTHQLLSAASSRGVGSFLFFSSGEVYGIDTQAPRAISESDYGYIDLTDIRSCYAESKRMGEAMCVAWAHQFKVPTKVVRPFHTYGPGMRLDDGRVFADFVRDILNGGPIVLHSDGSARRCFCYLADATSAFFTVLLRGEEGQAYNVANPGAECSIAELASRLAQVFTQDDITVERRHRADSAYMPSPIPVTRPSIAKIGALGWKPNVTIEDGFRRTVESYRADASGD
jgi:nucleoside-diphosphate-sugar epimerase